VNHDSTRAVSTGDIARLVHGTLHGSGDVVIQGIQSVGEASATDITLISSAGYARKWSVSTGGAALVSACIPIENVQVDDRPLICVDDAEVASMTVLEHFHVEETMPDVGVHPSAYVADDVDLGDQVRIGPFVCIERGAIIGDGVVLHRSVGVGASCVIGAHTVLYPNVTVYDTCRIGRFVRIHAGTVIGAPGFGFRPSPDGTGLRRLPHVGSVIIEDDVEIGPTSIVARGKFGSTRIGAGSKIDGMVSIAHNVKLGRNCVIAGMSGVAGSTEVGDGVMIGGHTCVREHLHLGHGARVAGGSVLMDDLGDGEDAAGAPALTGIQGLRQWSALRRLPGLIREMSRRQ